jgi:hypothetical protein
MWRLYLYNRSRAGATPEELGRELEVPADEIALRVEAARLCFEKQCLLASLVDTGLTRGSQVSAQQS